MKIFPVLLGLAAIAGTCGVSRTAPAAEANAKAAPAATPALASTVDPQVLQKLVARHREQVGRLANMETLQQSHNHPNAFPPRSHTFVLRLGRGVEVVTERHIEDHVLKQKDYFLYESRVYACRVIRHDPCMDGKTKRVVESQYLFHEGKPVYGALVSARVPLAVELPDFSKTPEKLLPIPSGLEGWGQQLTQRAFDITRTFRSGIGRYTFGDWDAWLLKDAPPENKEPQKMDDRSPDWLPAPNTLVLPVEDSLSPDGLYEIGWGYEKGPVDWKKLAFLEGHPEGTRFPSFSTKLAEGPLSEELNNDTNFLINHVSGKPLAVLNLEYPGERQRFNHDELLVHWSPSSTCFLVRTEQKWFTEYAEVAWIKDGVCEGSYDVIVPLLIAAEDAVKKSKHPAAARMKKTGDEAEDYMFSISRLLLEDDGKFEAQVVGQIPKDPEPSGFYEAIIEGTFSPGEKDDPAKLKVSKIRVLPVRKDG